MLIIVGVNKINDKNKAKNSVSSKTVKEKLLEKKNYKPKIKPSQSNPKNKFTKNADGTYSYRGKKYANKFGKEVYSIQFINRKKENDKFLTLMWIIRGWPKNTAGFIVKRKINNQPWTNLSKGTIFPEINPDRNWSALGLNQVQAKEFKTLLVAQEKEKRIKFVDKTKLLSYLEKKGVGAGDRILITRDNNNAFFLGYAAIDNNPQKGAKYALFSVGNDGDINKEALATCEYKEYNTLAKNPVVSELNRQISIKWSMPQEEYKKAGLVGFRVLEKERDSDNWRLIANTNKQTGENNNFDFKCSLKNSTQNKREFAIEAKGYITDKYQKKIVSFDPDKDGAPNKAHISLLQAKGENVIVHWTTQPKDLKKYKGFYVFRDSDFGDSGKISKLLPPKGNMSFTDDSKKQADENYHYRIIGVTLDGNEIKSDVKRIYSPAGNTMIESPKNLKMEIVKIDGNLKLKFTWDKAKSAAGYIFYHQSPLDKQLGQYGTMKTNSRVINYPSSGGVFTFGVSAYSSSNQESTKTLLKEINVPTTILPYLDNRRFEENCGDITLTWEDNEPSITHYEVFVKDKFIAKVAKDKRSFSILRDDIPKLKSKGISFNIVAVNPVAKHENLIGFGYEKPSDATYNLPVVKNLKCTLSKDKSNIAISWDKSDLEKIKYGVEILIDDQGSLQLRSVKESTVEDAKYCFKIPEEFKDIKKFYVRVYLSQPFMLNGLRRYSEGH